MKSQRKIQIGMSGRTCPRKAGVRSALLAMFLSAFVVTSRATAQNAAALMRQLSSAVADVVEQTLPSVVVIQTAAVRYHRLYDPFFGRRFAVPERLAGQGSGVIYDAAGHVLTSAHVVQGAQKINIVFHDETIRPAKLVGLDAASDIAVLRIEDVRGLKLAPIRFGDSDAIRVGEFVIAVGSPFNLQGSVSFGVLSQKGRTVGVLPYEDFLQTDAPINPGNSGGPLTDIEGRMIGVNAVIQTGAPGVAGNIGIGFAVPINFARRVADSIIRRGRFERPWIGIRPDEASEDAEKVTGLRVAEVFDNTPAQRAGIRAGDIIIEADGQPVQNLRDLLRAILRQGIGETLRLKIRRGNRLLDLTMPTERMPDFETMDR